MSVGTAAAIGIAAGVSTAGGIATGIIGSNAASDAASTQANAAVEAAQIQANQADKALAFQKQEFNTQQQELAPWLTGGQGAEVNLAYLLGVAPPSAFTGNAGVPSNTNFPTASSGLPGNIAPGGTQQVNSQGQTITKESGNAPLSVRQDLGNEHTPPNHLVPTGAKPAAPSGVPLSSLVNPSLGAFGSLSKPWTGTFTAPTAVTEQNDPGFQERLKMGQDALERSAAARGGLLSGTTATDINKYAQDYASNEYQNVYNRAFNQYAQAYNQFQTGQTNTYNRLAGLAGLGQQTAGTLGYLGNNAAGNVGNILIGTGAQIGGDLQNAAAARASGYVGGANAIGSGINSATSGLMNGLLLSQLLGKQGVPGYGGNTLG